MSADPSPMISLAVIIIGLIGLVLTVMALLTPFWVLRIRNELIKMNTTAGQIYKALYVLAAEPARKKEAPANPAPPGAEK
jgi:hypothetical protein